MSWLIYKGQLIARVNETLKSGESVLWSDTLTQDSVTDQQILINPKFAKASNAAKWEKQYYSDQCQHLLTAELIDSSGVYKHYFVKFG
jgi:hypothetical protein